jgi:hypothetical protein
VEKTTLFDVLFLKVTSHFFANLLPGRKVSPPPKSVFHSCIWPSVGLANATELLYVSGRKHPAPELKPKYASGIIEHVEFK